MAATTCAHVRFFACLVVCAGAPTHSSSSATSDSYSYDSYSYDDSATSTPPPPSPSPPAAEESYSYDSYEPTYDSTATKVGAIGSDDPKVVQLHQLASGQPLHKLTGHSSIDGSKHGTKDWHLDRGRDPCKLRAFGGSGGHSSTGAAAVLAFEVPAWSTELRTTLGVLGVSLCGPARPTGGLASNPYLMPLTSKVRDRYSVPCEEIAGARNRVGSFLIPFTGNKAATALATTGHGCRTFGGPQAPRLALLARDHPERGIELHTSGGLPCPSGSALTSSGSVGATATTSTTILLRCDKAAHTPVIKELALKNGCDLQLEIVSDAGCPHRFEPPKSDDDEGSYSYSYDSYSYDEEDDEDDEDCENCTPYRNCAECAHAKAAEAAAQAAQCVGGRTGCTLELLLSPECNPECANEACFWDNGACSRATLGCAGCLPAWLGDGECDDECFTESCGYDGGDCLDANGNFKTRQAPRCDDHCPASWQGDGECDPACNVQACMYDSGDCTPGACLLALAAPGAESALATSSPAMASEFSMGMGMGDDSVGGAGPPALAGGTIWYDLSALGVQHLTIPAGAVRLSERGGGLASEPVHLALALCEPLSIAAVAAEIPACAGAPIAAFEKSLKAAAANDRGRADAPFAWGPGRGDARGTPAAGTPLGLLASARHGQCILASIGALDTLEKQLIDPAMPTRGVQLDFSDGTACDEADEVNGDGTHHTRLNLMCAHDADGVQHLGWRRSGCTWEFTLRFSGACAQSGAPGAVAAAATACTARCLPAWRGDGVCDRLCNTTGCEYDGGDCLAHSEEKNLVESWLCGIQATVGRYRHQRGGGGGSSGGCEADNSTVGIALQSAMKAAHGVSGEALVWIAVGSSLAAVCLLVICGSVLAHNVSYIQQLVRSHEELQRANARERREREKLERERSVEMTGLMAGGDEEGADGGAGARTAPQTLTGVVLRVEKPGADAIAEGGSPASFLSPGYGVR